MLHSRMTYTNCSDASLTKQSRNFYFFAATAQKNTTEYLSNIQCHFMSTNQSTGLSSLSRHVIRPQLIAAHDKMLTATNNSRTLDIFQLQHSSNTRLITRNIPQICAIVNDVNDIFSYTLLICNSVLCCLVNGYLVIYARLCHYTHTPAKSHAFRMRFAQCNTAMLTHSEISQKFKIYYLTHCACHKKENASFSKSLLIYYDFTWRQCHINFWTEVQKKFLLLLFQVPVNS